MYDMFWGATFFEHELCRHDYRICRHGWIHFCDGVHDHYRCASVLVTIQSGAQRCLWRLPGTVTKRWWFSWTARTNRGEGCITCHWHEPHALLRKRKIVQHRHFEVGRVERARHVRCVLGRVVVQSWCQNGICHASPTWVTYSVLECRSMVTFRNGTSDAVEDTTSFRGHISTWRISYLGHESHVLQWETFQQQNLNMGRIEIQVWGCITCMYWRWCDDGG